MLLQKYKKINHEQTKKRKIMFFLKLYIRITFANAIKHDFKSKNPTTRWSDIIKLK